MRELRTFRIMICSLAAVFIFLLPLSRLAFSKNASSQQPDGGNFIDGSFSAEGKVLKNAFWDSSKYTEINNPLTLWQVAGEAALMHQDDDPLVELTSMSGSDPSQIGQLVLFYANRPVIEFDIASAEASPGDKLEIYIQELGGGSWARPEFEPILLGTVNLSDIQTPLHVEATKAADLFGPLKNKVDPQIGVSATVFFRLVTPNRLSRVRLDNFNITESV